MDKGIIRLIYFYAICLITLLVVLWGIVDTASAFISYSFEKSSRHFSSIQKSPEIPQIDDFFQNKMILDRMFDGISRIIIPGCVFLYFSSKIRKEEIEIH